MGLALTPQTISSIAQAMRDDLAVDGKDRPQWIISVYAPHKLAPAMIANTDMSREELRWQAYEARASNDSQKYVNLPLDSLCQCGGLTE